MRKKLVNTVHDYNILLVDDEIGIIDSIGTVLKRNGYMFKGCTHPLEAIEAVRNEHFDLLVLDFLMYPIHGDEVVEKIRKFNKEIYILLLTGHKDLAPPLETIKKLDIQGYCEKSDNFDQLLLLIESGLKSINQMRTITKFRDGLNKILQSVPKIYQLQPIDSILEEILVQIMPIVNGTNAFILVDNPTEENKDNKSIFRGIGKYKTDLNSFWLMLTPEFITNIGTARAERTNVFHEEGIIIPLINEYKHSLGILYVESPDREDGQYLLEIFSNQAASSVSNAFLHSLVNVKNEQLNSTYIQLKRNYLDTVQALRLAVDAKDVYTRGHSDRVAYYSVELGKAISLGPKDIQTLKLSGLFHDIGKIGTANDLLLKSEKLFPDEYEEIKKHSLTGAHILSVISFFKDVIPIVRSHHERIDGTGYPDGLTGDDIPYLAKIVSIADAFDAMMSDRMYRSRLEKDNIKQELLRGVGKQFDYHLVKTFIEIMDTLPPTEDIIMDDLSIEY
jgi:putative nucleotidyltransferase with HDIG domain